MNNGSTANSQPTITPNTLNAIVLNSSTSTSYSSSALHHHQSSSQENANPAYLASASNAANTAANGLFLLTQAHQELKKREEAQARAGNTAPANGVNGSANQSNGKRGTKRKSYDPISPPPTSAMRGGKRTRPTGRGRKASPMSPDMDNDDDDDAEDDDGVDFEDPDAGNIAGGRRSNKKPETEEEKRRNFLERNRQGILVHVISYKASHPLSE
jgi:ATF/CREB family transcription factor